MRFTAITSMAITLLFATQSLAETPMTAAEFDAYATGKTLTYSVGGEIYGAEQYLAGRRVVWAVKGDDCTDGIWYEDAGLICFAYEGLNTPQCWNFYLGPTGVRAQFVGDGPTSELSEVAQSPAPLSCAGPEVGV
jgi:hypothetical protein